MRLTFIAILVIVVSGITGYYLQTHQKNQPQTQNYKEPSEKPSVHYPVARSDPDQQKVTPPGSLDTFSSQDEGNESLLQGLRKIIGDEQLYKLFIPKEIVRRFVVTVANLTGQQLPKDSSIFKPLADDFRVDQDSDGYVLSKKNFSRYSKYVYLLNSVDTAELVAIYAHHYSLFEAAYQELGMGGYFNDCLVEAVDNALAAPDENGPVKLTHDGYYKFAVPRLESLSVAQKILIRMGPENETVAKKKLRQIRKLLTHLNKA